MFKIILSAALILAPVAIAFAADGPPDYLPQNAIDLSLVLAPPPANDSSTTKAELAEIHRTQAKATDAEKKQAVADDVESVFAFASVLGPKFAAANLPVAAPFFEHVRHAEGEFVDPAKKVFARPRPPRIDSTIPFCTAKLSESAAYPSGHASTAYLLAVVLAQVVPEKREAIFERAAEYAHNRIICGVHYPTDIEAGRISGTVIATLLMQNSSFRAEFGPARAEVRKALGLQAQ